MKRPGLDEAAEYYQKYITRVPGEDFLAQLRTSLDTTYKFLSDLTDEQWEHRYAPGKWSLKEAWIHVIDTERIMGNRAMRIARGDKTPLPGFDQDAYVPHSNADTRSPRSILEEYTATRLGTLAMLGHFTEEMLENRGTASGHPVSARALAFIIAGHELHHIAVTQENYLHA